MGLIYRKIKDQSSNEAKNGKWYGRLVNTGTMNIDAICKHINEHGSIYTPDVVKGVVEKFIQCFDHLLQDGHKLKLDGLGTFYLGIRTIGAETEEKFTAANIKALRLQFDADRGKDSVYDVNAMTRACNLTWIGDLLPEGASVTNTTGGTGSGNGNGNDEPIEQQP